MKRLCGLLLALALTGGLVMTGGTATAAEKKYLEKPFSREVVKRGDVDADQWNIEHVYEVQIRLRRLGLLEAKPNGVFGPQTEAAVKKFQEQRGLKVTGVVRHQTWEPLIRRSLRGRSAVPKACKTAGWHACYDRARHQLSLYRGGNLQNSWLVRGGAKGRETRTGSFTVFRRSEHHVSNLYGAPMPNAQFFSGGQALHGSRMMMDPYVGHSHGCVNMWVEDSRQLWNLTHDKTLRVHVYGAWD